MSDEIAALARGVQEHHDAVSGHIGRIDTSMAAISADLETIQTRMAANAIGVGGDRQSQAPSAGLKLLAEFARKGGQGDLGSFMRANPGLVSAGISAAMT